MRRAVCPGSFDPMTLGHLDIFTRAAGIFDEVVVAVGVNQSKSRLFTPEERIDLLERVCGDLPNVRVAGFTGLVTAFAVENDAVAIVKGLRAGADFDYELQMAQMNATLAPGVETVFLPTAPGLNFVSSSLVKEVASFGGDVRAFLPDLVHAAMLEKL